MAKSTFARLMGVLLVAVLVLVGVYVLLPFRYHSPSPPVPVLRACQDAAPGMERIGNNNGVQFDVSAKDFTIGEGWSDAAPLTHGFDLCPKNGKSLMSIELGKPLDNMAVDPIRVFSVRVESRSVFNDKGQVIGEDSWGYLSSGERWRNIHFRGRVAVKYGLVSESDARLFDRVINSACILPAPTS